MLASVVRSGAAAHYDIHLPVGGASFNAALKYNAALNKALGNKEIDFAAQHTPHVTLYLTAWTCPIPVPPDPGHATPDCPSQIEDAISSIMYDLYIPGQFGPCEITLSAPYAAGTYAMMNVTNTPCLQKYSDAIVNATHAFSQSNQTAPEWVKVACAFLGAARAPRSTPARPRRFTHHVAAAELTA
jgi:hypothetical protein